MREDFAVGDASLSFYFSQACISCGEGVSDYIDVAILRSFRCFSIRCAFCFRQDEWQLTTDNGEEEGEDEDEYEDGVYELCNALYDTSAKCNKYLSLESNSYEVSYEQSSLVQQLFY